MMPKPLEYLLLSLLWIGVAAYVLYAAGVARTRRASATVQRLEIEVVDSSSQGHLVSSAMVRGWLRDSGIATVGAAVDAVDLAGIEALVARNGFVSDVDAYVDCRGRMRIEISQRRPVLRLLTDGFDAYVTHEGFVFAAPRASSLYVPVVTGSYRPPFPSGYTGAAREWIDTERHKIDARIAELEREKYPFYEREQVNDEHIRALRRMFIKQGWFESDTVFKVKVEALRRHKADLRRRYRYETRLIREGIEGIEARQEAQRREQKKLEKSYEDFMKLLTFVEFVERDDFWRSEIVQIVAFTNSAGTLEINLIPRSGNHTILFGEAADVERKFDKLLRFYRNGMNNFGWSEYRIINVKYKDRVVCKK